MKKQKNTLEKEYEKYEEIENNLERERNRYKFAWKLEGTKKSFWNW